MARVDLTLGPLLYCWPPDRWHDFYARIADEAPVAHVCIGEVVCSKRWPFIAGQATRIIERLERAGKTVILSTLALPTLPRERREIAEMAGNSGRLVEANDISALPHLQGRPHAIGPFVNVYNEATLCFLVDRGATRVCLPPELPRTSIGAMVASAGHATIEVFAFGRVPLAISARCYHARLHGLSKDSCQFVCGRDPDGLVVETLGHQPFLVINGVQTLSYTCHALLDELDDLTHDGVVAFRLSPQDCDMVAIARIYDDFLAWRICDREAEANLREVYPVPLSNGFIHGEPGVKHVQSGQ